MRNSSFERWYFYSAPTKVLLPDPSISDFFPCAWYKAQPKPSLKASKSNLIGFSKSGHLKMGGVVR